MQDRAKVYVVMHKEIVQCSYEARSLFYSYKDMEMTLDTNQVYETVNMCYETGRLGLSDGPIYEHSAQ